jgi:hypothetical protein
MSIPDQPFLEANATAKYAGFRTRSINEYRYVPWGKVGVIGGACGLAAIALAWLLVRYAL